MKNKCETADGNCGDTEAMTHDRNGEESDTEAASNFNRETYSTYVT
jgi:hypothetical protein